MDASVRSAIAAKLGADVARARPLSGGDINDAFAIELADGRRAFAKTNDRADPRMFASEASGLAWLDAAGALRIPRVLAVSASAERPSYLVLELIEPGSRVSDFDERLGRGLAALHRFGADRFGLDDDNFIGSLPQSNRFHSSWAEFFRHERLEPQVERAARAGLVPRGRASRFERLYARLPELVGPAEPPARLHGDLWGGNLHVDEHGLPVLIDPAAYAGYREVDLAMMQLFGGFRPRVFDAYAEVHPLAAGHGERVALYQLYPLLVHLNLFGAGYWGSVEAVLRRYA